MTRLTFDDDELAALRRAIDTNSALAPGQRLRLLYSLHEPAQRTQHLVEYAYAMPSMAAVQAPGSTHRAVAKVHDALEAAWNAYDFPGSAPSLQTVRRCLTRITAAST